MNKCYFTLSLLIFGLVPAHAATITAQNNTSGSIIFIKGNLEVGDGDKFSVLASKINKALVVLDSDGGNLFSGLQIGNIIKNRMYSTAVLDNSTCASACGLIWFSGEQRYMSKTASIGFHSAYQVIDGRAEETGVGNALVGAYLSKLGANDSTVIFFTLAKPNEINWLTQKAAKELGISYFDISTIIKPTGRNLKIGYNVGNESNNNNLERQSLMLAEQYFEYMMYDEISAKYFLRTSLGENIIIDDQFVSQYDAISRTINEFFQWKSRVFEIEPESIEIYCQGINSCEISGDFAWAGSKENYEYGLGKFKFDIDFSKGAAKVFGKSIVF